MMKLVVLLLLLALLLGGMVLYHRRGMPRADAPALMVYCAAGLRKPVEAAAARYRQEFGVEIRLEFGGSGTLLSSLQVAKQGDLYLAADEGSVADAQKREVIQDVVPIAIQRPVIAVRAGNPKNIHTIADLLRDDVKVALANPEAASISRVSKAVLGETWDKLANHAAVMKPTVSEVAADLSLGAVDAAVIWDSIVAQFELEAVAVPDLSERQEKASACVIVFSKEPAGALRFARYLAAPEKGGAIFQTNGFTPAGGEAWAGEPGNQ